MEINVDMGSYHGYFNCNIVWGDSLIPQYWNPDTVRYDRHIATQFYNSYYPVVSDYPSGDVKHFVNHSNGSLHIHGDYLQSPAIVFPRGIAHPYLRHSRTFTGQVYLSYPEIMGIDIVKGSETMHTRFTELGPSSLAHLYHNVPYCNHYVNLKLFSPIWNRQFWHNTDGTVLYNSVRVDYDECLYAVDSSAFPNFPMRYTDNSIYDNGDHMQFGWLWDVSYMFAASGTWDYMIYTHDIELPGFIHNFANMFQFRTFDGWPKHIWFDNDTVNHIHDADGWPIQFDYYNHTVFASTNGMFMQTRNVSDSVFQNFNLPARLMFASYMFYSATLNPAIVDINECVMDNCKGMFQEAYFYNSDCQIKFDGGDISHAVTDLTDYVNFTQINDASYMFYNARGIHTENVYYPNNGVNNASYMFYAFGDTGYNHSIKPNMIFSTAIDNSGCTLNYCVFYAGEAGHYPFEIKFKINGMNTAELPSSVQIPDGVRFGSIDNPILKTTNNMHHMFQSANIQNTAIIIGNDVTAFNAEPYSVEEAFAWGGWNHPYIYVGVNSIKTSKAEGFLGANGVGDGGEYSSIVFAENSFNTADYTPDYHNTVNMVFRWCNDVNVNMMYVGPNALWLSRDMFPIWGNCHMNYLIFDKNSLGYAATAFFPTDSRTNISVDHMIFEGGHGNLYRMFYKCYDLKVSRLDIYDVPGHDDRTEMFQDCINMRCEDGIYLKGGGIGMFDGCTNLTGGVTAANFIIVASDVTRMFRNCWNLTQEFNNPFYSKIMVGMFENACFTANQDPFTFSSAVNMRRAFYNCKVRGPVGLRVDIGESVTDLIEGFANSTLKATEVYIRNEDCIWWDAFKNVERVDYIYTKSAECGTNTGPHIFGKGVPNVCTNVYAYNQSIAHQLAGHVRRPDGTTEAGFGDRYLMEGSGNWSGTDPDTGVPWDIHSDNWATSYPNTEDPSGQSTWSTPNGKGTIVFDNNYYGVWNPSDQAGTQVNIIGNVPW